MDLVSHKQKDEFAIARKRMVQEQLVRRGIVNTDVLSVMESLPRHHFVDEALKYQAYSDAPLNIGEGQTISQPYIVALMSECLQLTGAEKVLEIGTGCGYQTAVLSRLAKQVYTIERLKNLALAARTQFKKHHLRNIIMRVGDGSLGWSDAVPFDRILVTCASPAPPAVLLDQLSQGGVCIVPIAVGGDSQKLMRIRKTSQGLVQEDLGDCRFVKLIGKNGYQI